MDAPLYPPASAYVPPQRVPRGFSAAETSVAELKANPAAWAIVLKEMPAIEQRFGNEALRPHLGNFSLKSLVAFGAMPPDVVQRIDAQLRLLKPGT